MPRFNIEIAVSYKEGGARKGLEGVAEGADLATQKLQKMQLAQEALLAIGPKVFDALKSVFTKAIGEISDSQRVFSQLEAGVRSTGGAAGYTAKELDDLAGKLSDLTGIDDEVIGSAEAILLTFTAIGRETFPQVTQAALDLSTRFGMDLQSAITMMGKALNDPIKGLTSLGKAGVQFTEDQKKTIKTLVESGNLLQAQKMILKELETQVGGSAVAFRQTLPGALQALDTSFGNLAETVGEGLAPALVEAADALREWLQSPEAAKNARELGAAMGSVIKLAGGAARLLLDNIEAIKFALLSIIALQAPGYIASLALQLQAAAAAGRALAISNPLAWIPVALLGLNELIERFRDEQSAQISMNVQLSEATGAVADLRTEYGKLTAAQIESARAGLEALIVRRDQLEMERKAVTEAQQKLNPTSTPLSPRAQQQYKDYFGVSPQAAQQAADATRNMTDEQRNLTNIIDKATERLAKHEAALKSTAGSTAGLSDELKKAREKALEMIDALRETAEYRERLLAANRRGGAEAVREEEQAEARLNAVRQIEKGLREKNLKLSEEEIAQIIEYVKRAQEADAASDRLNKARDEASKGLKQLNELIAKLSRGEALAVGSTKEWADRLLALDAKAASLQVTLDQLVFGTQEWTAAQAALVEAQRALREGQEALLGVMDRLKQAQRDAAAVGDAGVAKELADIHARTAATLEGAKALAAFNRQEAIHQAAVGIADQVKPSSLTVDGIEEYMRKRAAAYKQAVAELTALYNAEDARARMDQVLAPIHAAAQSTHQLWVDTWVDIFETGGKGFGDLARQFVDTWKRALAQWLAEWIAAMLKARAAQATLTSGGGFQSGNYGNWLSAFFKGGGGQQFNYGAGSNLVGPPAEGAAGGSSAGISANALAGWALAAYGLFVVYKGFIEDSKTRWAEASTLGHSAGNDKGPKATVRKAIQQVIDAARELAKSVDLAYEQVGDVTVARRGKTFEVRIGTQRFGKVFEDLNAALEYATVQAVRTAELSGKLSDLVRAGLSNSDAATVDSFRSDLDLLRSVDSSNPLTDLTRNLASINEEYERQRERLIQLLHGSEELGRGLLNLDEAFKNMKLGDIRRQILGIAESEADRLRREKEEYNRYAQEQIDQIRRQIEAAREYRERLLNQQGRREGGGGFRPYDPGENPPGGAGASGGGGDGLGHGSAASLAATSGMDAVSRGMLSLAQTAFATAEALAGSSGLIGMSLADVDALIASLERQMESYQLITEEELQAAIRRANAAQAEAQANARRSLRDRIEDLRLEGGSEADRTMANLARQIRDMKEQAKEAHLPAAELAEAIRLLGEQAGRALRERIRPLLGGNYGVPDFLETFRRNQEEIEAQRRIAEAERRRIGGPSNRELDEAEANNRDLLRRSALEAINSFAGLSGGLDAVRFQANGLRQAVVQMGLSAEETDRLLAQINFGENLQIQNGINSVLDSLYGYVRETAKYSADAVEHERKKVALQFEIYKAQLMMYHLWEDPMEGPNTYVQGLWNDARDAALQAADGLQKAGSAIESAVTNINVANDGISRLSDLLKRWIDDTKALLVDQNLSSLSPQQRFEEASRQFYELAARARTGDSQAFEDAIGARRTALEIARSYFGGGAGYDQFFAQIMAASKDLASPSSQSLLLQDLIKRQIEDAAAAAQQQHEDLTTLRLELVAAIDRLLGKSNVLDGMPRFAAGGVVTRPTVGLFGEAGPEALIPLRGGAVPVAIHWAKGRQERAPERPAPAMRPDPRLDRLIELGEEQSKFLRQIRNKGAA